MPEPQYNTDAELAVLNILMLNPDLVYSVPSLKDFMFSSSSNILLYSTISEIAAQGHVPEYSLLLTYLDSKGKLREAGGKEYLDYIRNLVFSKDNIKEFERQVKESYKFRSAISIISNVNSQLASNACEVDTIIGNLRKSIDQIEESSGGEQVVDLYTASGDMWNGLVDRLANPGLRGVTTGFPKLDGQTTGFNPGDVWVIAGRPGSGKSTQLVNSALGTAKEKPVLIFSLEMNKTQLVERMIAIESGVPLMDIRLGALDQEKLNSIQEAIKRVKNLPIYIDTNYSTDEAYFSSTVKKYKKLKDISVVYFDYIQLASQRGEDQTAEIGRFSRSGKMLANELGLSVVFYSQLNRGVETREDKRPILPDLRQSGSLEEDADIVIMLYRDIYYNPATKWPQMMEYIIRKQRNGPTGTLPFRFEESTLKITDWDKKL